MTTELTSLRETFSHPNIRGLLDAFFPPQVLNDSQRVSSSARLLYEAPSDVHAIVAKIGRTEDVRLSPDNTRLAIADYLNNKVFLFSIRIENGTPSPWIAILDYSVISSDSLCSPHGIAFLNHDHIIVCNRAADVCVFRIPEAGELPRERKYKPIVTIPGVGLLRSPVKTPGSVDCYKLADNCYRFLVCNNHWNFITSHIISLGNRLTIKTEKILIENQLKIPDGISLSSDNTWIAISNHGRGQVLIYKNTLELNKNTAPAAILRGVVCPHGVRFTADGKVLVADAASQYLRVYVSKDGNWNGIHNPTKTIRLLNDDTFYCGRYDSREGGIKGIDLDKSNRVLITTSTLDVLGIYDFQKLLLTDNDANEQEMAELCRQRDWSLSRVKHGAENRRWTLNARVKDGFSRLQNRWRAYKDAVRARSKMCHLYLRNRLCNASILDPSGPVISLATQPYRLERVFYTIESIANGKRKPSQIILWVTDEESYSNPPDALRRLKLRGLDMRMTENLGPHNKYYPYVDRNHECVLPLVTADDDTIYNREWLSELIAAYENDSSAIHCFRARRMRIANTPRPRLLPYGSWTLCEDNQPSHLNFITGVGGVIYPLEFLKYLRRQGNAFLQCCPTADDVWLTVTALRAGFKIAQIKSTSEDLITIPKTQIKSLFNFNVLLGANQIQLEKTYSEADLSALWYYQQASEGIFLSERNHLEIEISNKNPIPA